MRKRMLYVFLIVMVSIILRVYPTLISGLPFSTDAWPLIRNAEKLLEKSPIPLNSGVFDDYNIYWPLSQIYGAVVSEILSSSLLNVMRIYVPFIAALSPIMLYLLLKRLTGSGFLGFLGGLLFACGGPYAVFTSGVTKESFTSLFFIQSIYLFSALSPFAETFIVFMIIVTALIMSHHLSYIVSTAVLVNILVAEIFLPKLRRFPIKRRMTMLSFSAVIGLIYYLAYALPGLKRILGFSDWLSVFSFQVLTFMIMFYVVARPKPRRLPNAWIAMILVSYVSLMLNQVVPLLPAAPRLSAIAFFYAYILVSLGLFAVIGLYSVKERRLDGEVYPFLFWISAVLGLEGYAVFAADPSLSLTLAYRLPNFILPALVALAVIGILRITLIGKGRFTRIISLLFFMFFTAALASQSYSAVFLQENYLGYQWLYVPQEYQQAVWMKSYLEGQIVYGDLKVKYLAGDYFGLRVDSGDGYAFLAGEGASCSGKLFAVYREMMKNGYLLGPYGVKIPRTWNERLDNRNIIFSNLYTAVYEL